MFHSNPLPPFNNIFTAAVWRRVGSGSASDGSDNQFTVVGVNTIHISDDQINKPLLYVVHESEQITVQAGDVIGWGSILGNLPFELNSGVKNLVLKKEMADTISEHEIVVFDSLSGKVQVAISATVKPFEGKSLNSSVRLLGT